FSRVQAAAQRKLLIVTELRHDAVEIEREWTDTGRRRLRTHDARGRDEHEHADEKRLSNLRAGIGVSMDDAEHPSEFYRSNSRSRCCSSAPTTKWATLRARHAASFSGAQREKSTAVCGESE